MSLIVLSVLTQGTLSYLALNEKINIKKKVEVTFTPFLIDYECTKKKPFKITVK